MVKFEVKTAAVAFIRPFAEMAYKLKLKKEIGLIKGKKIAIYTSLFGQYDSLRKIRPQSIPVDWICFADREIKGDGWQCIVKRPQFDDPRKAAKWYKLNGSFVEELSHYDHTIYIDASAEILSRYFAEIYLGGTRTIGFHRHPARSSYVKEAEVSARMVKYQNCDLVGQASKYYCELGRDDELWAGGVIVRKNKTPEFDATWWKEMSKSLQDQISLPYAASCSKTVISPLPTSQYSHIFIRFNVIHRLHEYQRA